VRLGEMHPPPFLFQRWVNKSQNKCLWPRTVVLFLPFIKTSTLPLSSPLLLPAERSRGEIWGRTRGYSLFFSCEM